MFDRITLDRETLKVLAADTRVDILKMLGERKQTLTDISEKLEMSPSTIKEHLDRLLEAGLIEQIPAETKWKYYNLTRKGKNIVSPSETSILILLVTSVLVLVGSLASLAKRFLTFPEEPTMLMAVESARDFAEKAPAAGLPYLEIALIVISSVTAGFLIGKTLKR
ncbi:MAG: winged helix-turn-helix domain-containing protein [Candidatus Altiarchaeota archaeon]